MNWIQSQLGSLKKCLHELLPLRTALINKSLTTGIFPKECKNAIIRPMLKKSTLDPEVLMNYKPLSNLHFVSKILEKIVGQRLEEHLNRYSLHDPLQSAYRKGHSTETAILKISNDINVSLDQSGCVVLASLDLSAAFDTVDHDIFLHRLQSTYGISGIFYCWFKSYLENRKLRVCVHSSHSETQKLKCGVPQGSVLGARMYDSVDEFNYLGIILHERLTWKNHINIVTNKIAKVSGILNRLKHIFPQNVLLSLCFYAKQIFLQQYTYTCNILNCYTCKHAQ